ncbi:DUF1844 domain-containing protein [bacterium]|nr:DUF1844 domain-containing protein [bacterium]
MSEKVTFIDYLLLLSTQALYGLGAIADPQSGKTEVNLPLARYTIDILGLLEEKTRGNLTQEESALLADTLTQLRLTFVDVAEKEKKKSEGG